MGAVTPLGLDVPSTWDALIKGKSGVDRISLFDPESHDTKIAAEVKGFDPFNYIDRKEARHMDRFTQFAVVASRQAVEHSGLDINHKSAEDVGVIIGSGIGGLNTLSTQFAVLADRGPGRVSPFIIPMMITDGATGQVSIDIGAKGVNFCVTSACSSGTDAIGVAYEIIKRGDINVMVTGGTEAAITPIGVAGFNSAGALSKRSNDEPQKASCPFDMERDGFIMGEGAAVVILENLAHAKKRGASILAEVVGYGATSDAFHITSPAPGGEGGAKAMKNALRRGRIGTSEIDYINAHGTSTQLNDKCETAAIKTVFGDDAYNIPISSTKSMLGHLIGAAGAIEAIICSLTIKHGIIPPTTNLVHPDPECDLDYVPNTARRKKVRTALSNSFGFGGHNSVLIIREYTKDG